MNRFVPICKIVGRDASTLRLCMIAGVKIDNVGSLLTRSVYWNRRLCPSRRCIFVISLTPCEGGRQGGGREGRKGYADDGPDMTRLASSNYHLHKLASIQQYSILTIFKMFACEVNRKKKKLNMKKKKRSSWNVISEFNQRNGQMDFSAGFFYSTMHDITRQ